MSELDLIKKLERLGEERPNREWVDFTRESILASNPVMQKQGISLFMDNFNLASLAPMMVCIFAALIFGGFINYFNNDEEGETMAENNNMMATDLMAALSDVQEHQVVEENNKSEINNVETPLVAGIESNIEAKDYNLGDVIDDINKEDVSEEIANRIERIKNEVKECKRLESQGLIEKNSEQKEMCNSLEEQLNYFEKILGEQKSE